MELYVIRHAIAESRGEGKKDEERSVVDEGFKETKKVSKLLKKLKAKPDIIITSPLTRAIQTADILAKKLNYKKKILFSNELLPEAKPSDVMDLVKSKLSSKIKRLFIVGHMPLLGDFISLAIGIKNYTFDIEKSGIYILEANYEESKQLEFRIKGYITPKIARRLK